MGYKTEFIVPPTGLLTFRLKIPSLQRYNLHYTRKIVTRIYLNDKYKIYILCLGKKNKFGQITLLRYDKFEPSAGGKDWIGSCLKHIEIVFRIKSPPLYAPIG